MRRRTRWRGATGRRAFPVRAGVARCAAGGGHRAQRRRRAASRPNVGGVLPISFCGGPDRVVEQIRRCREEIGAGVLDLSLQDPGTGDTGAMMEALDLFGRKVLPRIREI